VRKICSQVGGGTLTATSIEEGQTTGERDVEAFGQAFHDAAQRLKERDAHVGGHD